MKTMLVTGGTVFVSRYAAEYFMERGWQVSVLNRGTRPQVDGAALIQADRHGLSDELKGRRFDAVLDVTAYTPQDVNGLLDALDGYGAYVLISSSAVYPETTPQPFREDAPIGQNAVWGLYGTGKAGAEKTLRQRDPGAYIIRPPYLYGPGNNVYREAFAFDCARQNRLFHLPGDGSMQLQFFHIRDLCRLMEALLNDKPAKRVWNCGNPQTVSVREWAELCYAAAGKQPAFAQVHEPGLDQRAYFSFYDYEYALDVQAQMELLGGVIPLADGLKEAFAWYQTHEDQVRKKPLLDFIDRHF